MKNAVQIGAARQKSCEMLENPLQGPVWDQFLPVVQAQAGRQIKGPKANLDKSGQHQDLLDIRLERFRYIKDPLFAGVRVHRTEKEVFGQKRTIVITRSRALLQGQVRGIRQHLAKKLKALRELQNRVARSHEPGWKGKPYTYSAQLNRPPVLR